MGKFVVCLDKKLALTDFEEGMIKKNKKKRWRIEFKINRRELK
jgi:hypothetical protein